MKLIGIQSLITLVTHITFIMLAFWSIQEVHLERLMPLRPLQGKLLIVLLSVTIGYTCSSFFLSFFDNVRNLIFLIK